MEAEEGGRGGVVSAKKVPEVREGDVCKVRGETQRQRDDQRVARGGWDDGGMMRWTRVSGSVGDGATRCP